MAQPRLDEQCAARETRWQRIKAPHSFDPAAGITHVRPFWHWIHVQTAIRRLRWRYMAWQQRNS